MYGRPEYISIAITDKGTHLLRISEIVNVAPIDATSTAIHLSNSSASANGFLDLTHASDSSTGNIVTMGNINDAITAALEWDVAKKGPKAVYAVTLTYAVSALAWA